MIRHATGRALEQQLTRFSDQLQEIEIERLDEVVRRRETREPLAYILGEKEFYGRSFVVDPRVLIPRPETEQLIDLCIQFVSESHLSHPKICDIGTGSGAIAITLALELEDAHITATDISADALQLARENAEKLGAKVCFAVEDATRTGSTGRFDLVLSNPPYIESHKIAQLQPEVRDWEPRLALDGGADGMSVLRPLLRSLPGLLYDDRPAGAFVEIDPPIVERCVDTAREALPDASIEVHRDYAGLERVLVVIRE